MARGIGWGRARLAKPLFVADTVAPLASVLAIAAVAVEVPRPTIAAWGWRCLLWMWSIGWWRFTGRNRVDVFSSLDQRRITFEVQQVLTLGRDQLECQSGVLLNLGQETRSDIGLRRRSEAGDEDQALELIFRERSQLEPRALAVHVAGVRDVIVCLTFGQLQAIVTVVE